MIATVVALATASLFLGLLPSVFVISGSVFAISSFLGAEPTELIRSPGVLNSQQVGVQILYGIGSGALIGAGGIVVRLFLELIGQLAFGQNYFEFRRDEQTAFSRFAVVVSGYYILSPEILLPSLSLLGELTAAIHSGMFGVQSLLIVFGKALLLALTLCLPAVVLVLGATGVMVLLNRYTPVESGLFHSVRMPIVMLFLLTASVALDGRLRAELLNISRFYG